VLKRTTLLCTPCSPAGCSQQMEPDMTSPPGVTVTFTVVAEIPEPNIELRLVGSSSEIGEWQPCLGRVLHRVHSKQHLWTTAVRFADSTDKVSFRFAIQWPDGVMQWEQGRIRVVNCLQEGWLVCIFDDVGPGHDVPEIIPLSSYDKSASMLLWEATCSETCFGDTLMVVGGDPVLGAWAPAHGMALTTSTALFPRWFGAAFLSAGGKIPLEWKLVINRADGSIDWESGENRCTMLPATPQELSVSIIGSWFGSSAYKDVTERLLIGPAALTLNQDNIPRPPSNLSTCSTHPGDDSVTDLLGLLGEPRQKKDVGEVLWAGAWVLPKPDVPCEDAHFISSRSLGVADGIGSMRRFAKHGVDSAAYATELMALAKDALSPGGAASQEADKVEERAAKAIAVAQQGANAYGAATMTVLDLQDGKLGAANLGDSGFMVLRWSAPARKL